MSQRSRYRAERGRTQREGSAAMALYHLEERQKARAERFKPYNIHKTIAKAITGGPRRKRRK